MDTATTLRTTSLIGLTTSIHLSGIYFSSSHLALPLLYRMPTDASTQAFTQLYYRGAKTVVPMALFSSLCAGVAAYLDTDQRRRVGYAVAAVATIATLPWTQLVMMDTNHALLAIGADQKAREKVSAAEVEGLLRRWTWMNFVRSGFAAVGGVVGLMVVVDSL